MVSMLRAGRAVCLVFVLIMVLCAGIVRAGYYDRYNGYGGRAAGMGGALTALADDSSAVFWNPAGLANVGHIEASLMMGHMQLYTGVFPFRRFTAALSNYSYDYGLNRYTFSLGMPVNNRWQIGASIHYGYYKEKGHYNGFTAIKTQGILFDAGVQYNVSDSVSFGATYWPKIKLKLNEPPGWWGYATAPFDYVVLPSKIGLGAGYRKGQMALGVGYDFIRKISDLQSIAIENDYPDSDQSTFKAGIEYGLFGGHFPVRMGINYSFAQAYPDTSSVLNKSIGLGLKLGGFRLDGAFIFKNEKNAWGSQDIISGNLSLGWVFKSKGEEIGGGLKIVR